MPMAKPHRQVTMAVTKLWNGKSVHATSLEFTKVFTGVPMVRYAGGRYRMDQKDVTDYPIIDWSTHPAQKKNIKYPDGR